jgi:serine/threonine protein kinase
LNGASPSVSSYHIARRLSTAAGVVEAFVGVETTTGRPVVAKRLVAPWTREAWDFAARFVSDSEAYHGVPGLTEWLDIGTSRDTLWLVQALVDGEGLRHLLNALAQQKGFIAPNEGLAVVGQLATLVATLHARQEPLVHGDLSASTVLLTPAGDLLLTDAGLTRWLSLSPTAGPPRAEPYTIAPEQLGGRAGPATDVFRIGLLLHELAVGQALFFSSDPVQALVQCQRYTGVSEDDVAQVPQPWRSLLVRMLAVEPEDRPTAAEVDEVLRAAADQAGWRHHQDISRLVVRARPGRHSLVELAQGGTQELELTPIPGRRSGPSTTPAHVLQGARHTGTFSALPTVNSPERPVMSSVHVTLSPPSDEPPRTPPAPAPTPASAVPSPPAPTASSSAGHQAVVGRITTRKMRRRELDAARAEPAEARASPPAPSTPPDPRAPRDARLGELLVEQGVITSRQLDEALQSVATYGGTLADALQSAGVTDEDTIVATLAGVTHTPHMTAAKLLEMPPPAEALQRVPLQLARDLDLVPLGLKGGTQLLVAMKDPMDGVAQERLKAAAGVRSLVAVRAGESAIRRTRNRFYTGKDDDTPDWLERAALSRAPSRPPFPMPSHERSGDFPVVTGALEMASPVPAAPPPAVAARFDAASGRLVHALLKMLDERGQQALFLSGLAAGLARRLGASEAETEQVRFAAVALCVANLLDGRPVHDVPGLASLSGILGEAGWNAVEPLVSPWLSWPTDWPPGAAGQGLCLAFSFSAHAGTARPRGSQLGAVLTSFRAQGTVSRAHLEALVTELGGA